jgi:hypothetical protein
VSRVAERVAAGAAWLDEHEPGWWREDSPHPVSLFSLDMAAGCLCILGQLYNHIAVESAGGYMSGFDWASECLDFGSLSERDLGFALNMSPPDNDPLADWRPIQAEWVRVITERRTPCRS